MKKLAIVATGLLLAAAAAFGVAQAQTAAAYGTLLNGTTGMDNFNIVGNANWRVMDDAMGANLGGGYLVTKESYGDFKATAEVWTDGPANSGVFIRCENPNQIGAGNCYEVNVFDTRPGQEYATGGIVDTVKRNGVYTAANKWNTLVIEAKGGHFKITFNGVVSAEGDDAKHPRGRIALQYGGGLVKFRKFTVEKL